MDIFIQIIETTFGLCWALFVLLLKIAFIALTVWVVYASAF